MSFAQMIQEADERRAADAKRFAELDTQECQLCHARGNDKRSLWMSCLYAVHEVVPEMVDTTGVDTLPEGKRGQYYLRICKNCRGELLRLLETWRREAVQRRELPKDHDGHIDPHTDRNIPIREHGRISWLTSEEAEARFRR